LEVWTLSLSNGKSEPAWVTHALERVGWESGTGRDTEKSKLQGGFGAGQNIKKKQVGEGDPLTRDGSSQDRSRQRKKASKQGTHSPEGANLKTGQDR